MQCYTKERIVTHTHLSFVFLTGFTLQHISNKIFNSGTKSFKAIIISTTPRSSFLLNASPPDETPTYKT